MYVGFRSGLTDKRVRQRRLGQQAVDQKLFGLFVLFSGQQGREFGSVQKPLSRVGNFRFYKLFFRKQILLFEKIFIFEFISEAQGKISL